MFQEPKTKSQESLWHPHASFAALQARASMLENIRAFFKARNVLEVETPLMCQAAIQDPHLHPIPAHYVGFGETEPHTFYLQTSPEFAMKRLLAAKIGAIYQLCKAFRNGETGKLHNPEFSILEWYRPGFDHLQLMDELEAFLAEIIATEPAQRISYQQVFLTYLNIDPFLASLQELQQKAYDIGLDLVTQTSQIGLKNKEPDFLFNLDFDIDLDVALEAPLQPALTQNLNETLSRDDWLNLLMTHGIEPKLGFEHPVIVFDFPSSQAALAKTRRHVSGKFEVAERFEVYIKGMEIANGYHELTDATIQEQRFKADAAMRESLNHPQIPIDHHLINALKAGLPSCAGIALGIDRLLMLKLNASHIQEVVTFTIERA